MAKLNPTGGALIYATFLGGDGGESGSGIVVDGSGPAYVTGHTTSAAFPVTAGAFDTSFNGSWDIFVVKLNGTGSSLVYGTLVGGLGEDFGSAIAIDVGSKAAYVTGFSGDFDFPTTAGAYDTTHNGVSDAIVFKLNPSGSALVYSTYLGGDETDRGYGIAVDSSGFAHITGITYSSGFPTTGGAFSTTFNGGVSDAFVANSTRPARPWPTTPSWEGMPTTAALALLLIAAGWPTSQVRPILSTSPPPPAPSTERSMAASAMRLLSS